MDGPTNEPRDKGILGVGCSRYASQCNLSQMVESAKEKLFSGTEEGNDYFVSNLGCYDRSSTVSLVNGEVIRMDDLRIGQFVQVTDPAGMEGTSKFIGWTEKHHSLTELYRLTTESENVLTMTGSPHAERLL